MDQWVSGHSKRRIASRGDAWALFSPGLAHAPREMLWVAHLDDRRGLIGLRFRYSPSRCVVDFPIRAIVADAIALGSQGLVLAHNHPGGDASPTAADLEATRVLATVAGPIGLRLHDHLVFAGAQCVSLREAGYL